MAEHQRPLLIRERGRLAAMGVGKLGGFSMSLIRLVQEVANRLSDCDFAPLSTSVSTTPAAETFLRRRLKISFCN